MNWYVGLKDADGRWALITREYCRRPKMMKYADGSRTLVAPTFTPYLEKAEVFESIEKAHEIFSWVAGAWKKMRNPLGVYQDLRSIPEDEIMLYLVGQALEDGSVRGAFDG